MDGVFHLAAIASVERCNEAWLKSHRTNLGGTITVFEAVRAAASPPVPVIWASSAAIYGPSKVLPITEDTPPDPISPYGADKLGSELHASVAADLFGVPNIALRFFNVFGKGQDPRSPYAGVISIFADRLAKGLPITIHGDGEQTRDFVYVGDVITALIAGMKVRLGDRKSGRPARFDALNVCTGRAVSLNLLVETLQGLINDAGTSVNNGPARSGDIRHFAWRSDQNEPDSQCSCINSAGRRVAGLVGCVARKMSKPCTTIWHSVIHQKTMDEFRAFCNMAILKKRTGAGVLLLSYRETP